MSARYGKMYSLCRSLGRWPISETVASPENISCLAPRRSTMARTMTTTDDPRDRRKQQPAKSSAADISDDPSNLLHPDNVKDLSALEVAKLRVTYGLVKEHVEALERNIETVDPEKNPLIDPRSFNIKRLPKLSPELLARFRQELPSDVAAVSRPVATHGIWEASSTEEASDRQPELQNDRAAEWAVVDERTMEARQFSRMQRQSFAMPGDVSFRSDVPAVIPKRKKKICPLKDERGRVKVDFRAIATLSSYLSENAKILPKRRSGLSAKAQRKVARAVKTARTMALLNPEPKPILSAEELLELARTLK